MSFTHNYYNNNKPIKQKPFVSSNKSFKTTSITDFFSVNSNNEHNIDEKSPVKDNNSIDYSENKTIVIENSPNNNNKNGKGNSPHNKEYKEEAINKVSPLGKKLKRLNYEVILIDEDDEEGIQSQDKELPKTTIINNINKTNNHLPVRNNNNKGMSNSKPPPSSKKSSSSFVPPTIINKPNIIAPTPIPTLNKTNTTTPTANVNNDNNNFDDFGDFEEFNSREFEEFQEFQGFEDFDQLYEETVAPSLSNPTPTSIPIQPKSNGFSSSLSLLQQNNNNNNTNKTTTTTSSITTNVNISLNKPKTTTTTTIKPIISKPLAFSTSNVTMSTPTLSLSLKKFTSSSSSSSSSSITSLTNNSILHNVNKQPKNMVSSIIPPQSKSMANQYQTIKPSSFSLMTKSVQNNTDMFSKTSTGTKPVGIPFSIIKVSESLSEEQYNVLKMIVDSNNLFFTGSAGTGKSFLLKEIVRVLRLMHPSSIFLTASTGIAACNIGGTTIHFFAGIGLGEKTPAEHSKMILNNKMGYSRWIECKVLIIDEVSMISALLLDKLEEIARTVRKNQKPFGGIQVVLCGDFCQLPPVSKASKSDPSSQFCFRANCWDSLIGNQCIQLKKVYRQKDQSFVDILNQLRMGIITERAIETLNCCWNRELPTDDGIIPTTLYPHRARVDQENQDRLSRLSGDSKTFEAIDTFQPNFKDTLKNSNAPESITLKIGAQVILIKNLDMENELVNGSRGVIIEWTDYPNQEEALPVVRFSNDIVRVIGRETWRNEFGEVVISSRRQVPLNLAWALSIHKGQGMTIDKLVINLDGIFENGQAYVALSRSSGLSGLRLVSKFKRDHLKVDKDVIDFYKSLK